MAKKIALSQSMTQKRSQLNGYQQGTVAFLLVLLAGFIFLPIITISSLTGSEISSFKLYSGFMLKTSVIVTLTILFLLAHNTSPSFQHKLHKLFGMTTENPYLTNVRGIFIIIVSMFSIGDTVNVLKQNINSTVSVSRWFLILGLLVVLGLAMNAMIARVEHNKKRLSQEIKIKKGQDHSGYENQLSQQAQDKFKGLFENTDESSSEEK